MTKQFLIEFESDERTRWLLDDEKFRHLLEHLAQVAGGSQTQGTMPCITVVPLEKFWREEWNGQVANYRTLR
jgi:hypothetical protein